MLLTSCSPIFLSNDILHFSEQNQKCSLYKTQRDTYHSLLSQNNDVVLIGDSYLDGYSVDSEPIKSWGQFFMDKWKVGKTYLFPQSGAGFIREAKHKTFKTLVSQASQDVLNNETVRYVVFGGGYNDVKELDENLMDAIEDTVLITHESFPNAIICLSMIGWNRESSEIQNELDGTIRACFQQAAEEYDNVIYLSKPENLLKENLEYVSIDNVHPNLDGEKALGKAFFVNLQQHFVQSLPKTLPH